MGNNTFFINNTRKRLTLDAIYNARTLNIFCDAGVIQTIDNKAISSYGAIAVCHDGIVEETYGIEPDCTNNRGEILAVRAAIYLAIKYQNRYDIINIFSDSQISIFGLRDRLPNWKIDPVKKCFLTSKNYPVMNQDIFIQIAILMINNNLKINFLHQKGHVKTSSTPSFEHARKVFKLSNNINIDIDDAVIVYISKWNCTVDMNCKFRVEKQESYPMARRPIKYVLLSDENKDMYSKLCTNPNIMNGDFSY